MKKNKLKPAAWLGMLIPVFCVLLSYGSNTTGYNDDDLKAATDKYWADSEAALKKVAAEKNNHQAALLLAQMDKDFPPRFEQIITMTTKWRKTHTKKELEEMTKWGQANAHYKAIVEYSSPDLLTKRDKEFLQAWEKYSVDLAQAGRKGMMAAK